MLADTILSEQEFAQLRKLLRKMDIPDHRRGNLEIQGARWLYKHLALMNASKPEYPQIMALLKRISLIDD